MTWGETSKELHNETEKAKPKAFSTSDAADIVSGKSSGEGTKRSPICIAFYGHDGTCKSGVCLDSRFDDEIAAGKKVIIIDVDGTAGPLKEKYFPDDENIRIIDPFMLLPDGEIDYLSTYNKILAVVKYIYENEADLNLATVALDGLDTLLKIAEYVMRYEDFKADPDVQIKDRWQWANRNRRYLVPIFMLRRLKCRKLFTTHYKELKQYASGQLIHLDWVPDWEKSTPGLMFQKVEMVRKDLPDKVQFLAKVEKAKGALPLEGKEFMVAEVEYPKDKLNPNSTAVFKWHGLRDLYKAIEEIQKPLNKPKEKQ
jgi:hypothetical protein